MNETDAIDAIAEHYRAIIELIGEDTSRQGLLNTPERAAKALWYATRGYRQEASDVIHGALFDADGADGMIVVSDIEFYSLCEHHMLPFYGHVDVGYLPGKKIIGLSKVARMVDMFARRLQVQERFTEELAEALMDAIGARGVIVKARAHHLCMKMRGVQKQDSTTITIASKGLFNVDLSLQDRFLSMV